MIEMNEFTSHFVKLLRNEFESRLYFVGLQGSYANDEATETSDIDMVVILDELTVADIEKYNRILDTLPCRNLMCGFISGKSELFNWNRAELFQFYYDTKPLVGNLDELLLLINEETIRQSIKAELCNIYHACVHNMLYEKDINILKSLYKSASFVVQAVYFMNSGEYVGRKNELMKLVNHENALILKNLFLLKNNTEIDFNALSDSLFFWSKSMINHYFER